MFWKIVGVLIVVWLAFTVIGAVVKGLFWLAVIGGVLFLGTAAYGAIKGRDETKRLRS
ncbi:hypothetical protein SAMN05421810_103356 [Amycolatopsis arida]|uniref:Uncharacterized protein n=1 Tax=Amycolatopsis arida TaxID=587909 RepID=A0A1I5T1K6_9PSEU|nr:hypothetical protein [Amycolatopsis arida]TDX96265.1 hypothetical protein CLV69_103402 [Amycolatopsis arida]SFP76925.1 hypothetical protein SAMN05421810_103356 [Amycolatopsis arida]